MSTRALLAGFLAFLLYRRRRRPKLRVVRSAVPEPRPVPQWEPPARGEE